MGKGGFTYSKRMVLSEQVQSLWRSEGTRPLKWRFSGEGEGGGLKGDVSMNW